MLVILPSYLVDGSGYESHAPSMREARGKSYRDTKLHQSYLVLPQFSSVRIGMESIISTDVSPKLIFYLLIREKSNDLIGSFASEHTVQN